jgi:hypothetical protein
MILRQWEMNRHADKLRSAIESCDVYYLTTFREYETFFYDSFVKPFLSHKYRGDFREISLVNPAPMFLENLVMLGLEDMAISVTNSHGLALSLNQLEKVSPFLTSLEIRKDWFSDPPFECPSEGLCFPMLRHLIGLEPGMVQLLTLRNWKKVFPSLTKITLHEKALEDYVEHSVIASVFKTIPLCELNVQDSRAFTKFLSETYLPDLEKMTVTDIKGDNPGLMRNIPTWISYLSLEFSSLDILSNSIYHLPELPHLHLTVSKADVFDILSGWPKDRKHWKVTLNLDASYLPAIPPEFPNFAYQTSNYDFT